MVSTLTKEVLLKYKTNIFVELGSSVGDGVQVALDTGFDTVYTIEKDIKYYNITKNRYINNPNVICIHGDSVEELKNVLMSNPVKLTIWMDAHNDGSCPILKELDVIRMFSKNNNNILIDDMRMFGKREHEFITSEEIIRSIKDINVNYAISYEPSVYGQYDILSAVIND